MKSGTLGPNLVDRLQPLTDRMRRLQDRLGLRQHEVSRVWRRWGGARRGEGTLTILLDEPLDPRPLIVDRATKYDLQPGGRVEVGAISLVEVSLSYSEGDLTGPAPLDPREEWFYRVTDNHGQGIRTMYFVLQGVPVPDRMNRMGWTLDLVRSRFQEP